ncbi:MAG: hypothetical protein P8099_03680 [Gemmatimonadota bacterium]|jgi:hypothetical protein
MKKLTAMLLGLFVLFGANSLAAQNSVTATGNVSITIGSIAYINVPSPDVAFNNPTNTDFATGYIDANNTVAVQYGSNAPHDLQIQLDQLGGKAVSDLEWSVDGGSSWTPMTTAAVNMVSQPAGGQENATVNFRMLLNWATDAAGTYSGQLTYTVVAN